MRTIKFRAWVKTKKEGHEMFGVQMISWIGKEVILSGLGGSIGLEDCDLMQFTGLHDKNGNEIYEGDIIRRGLQPSQQRIVKWKESRQFTGFNLGKATGIWEVIGNIYENPSLLQSPTQEKVKE